MVRKPPFLDGLHVAQTSTGVRRLTTVRMLLIRRLHGQPFSQTVAPIASAGSLWKRMLTSLWACGVRQRSAQQDRWAFAEMDALTRIV
jgi:hypothetical protein